MIVEFLIYHMIYFTVMWVLILLISKRFILEPLGQLSFIDKITYYNLIKGSERTQFGLFRHFMNERFILVGISIRFIYEMSILNELIDKSIFTVIFILFIFECIIFGFAFYKSHNKVTILVGKKS